MIGKTLGHYQITGKLGEGGMGAVYKARDLHLDRFVALKILPAEKVADPDRKRRFVQEAKAASALNHPNIVHVYDIDQSDGTDYIAMEYVDGKTLDQRIGHRGLHLYDSLKYAVQIADGLAKAHSAGIVHRDLKPTNIMVNEDGVVKVLDFGLAKLTEQVQADESASTATVDAEGRPITEEGVIIGTVAYMSPEQAEGKKVDARSDIFSLGSVLYEMVTGQKAFQGTSRMSTLSAILHQEPKPVSGIMPTIPADLEKLINRCLRKDPQRRWQAMADLKVALDELREDSASGKSVPAPKPIRHRLLRVAILAGVLAIIAGLGVLSWLRRASGPPQAPVLTRLTSDSGLATNPAISPDGKLLAYASDREGHMDIWVRQIPVGEPIRVTHDPIGASNPSFSPDSSRIVFHSERDGGGVYAIPALGGEERLIVRQGRTPRFSPDGAWIAFAQDKSSPMEAVFIISSMGGQLRQITADLETARDPVWSADGKYLLYWGQATDPFESRDWCVAHLEGGTPVKTGMLGALKQQGIDRPVPHDWVGDDVFFSGTSGSSINLWRVTLSSKNWRVTGPAVRLTFGTGAEIEPSVTIGPQGTLRVVFASQTSNLDIWSLPVDANEGRIVGELQRVTGDPATDGRPSVSADGKKMAFVSGRSGNSEIWLKDLETGKERALTGPPGQKHHPVISGDGSSVVCNVDTASRPTYVVPVAGGEAEKLCDDCYVAEDLSADGRRLLFGHTTGPETKPLFMVFLLDLDSRKRFQLLSHPRWSLWGPSFSPDGRWISFHAVDFEPRGVYVAPFREDATLEEKDWIAVDGSGEQARWSPDGNLLYYLSRRDGFLCLWAQHLDPATKRPAGSPFAVYHSHSATRSIGSVYAAIVRPAVVRGKVLFTQNELAGNIWMMEIPQRKQYD